MLGASMRVCARWGPPGRNQLVAHDLVLKAGYLHGNLPINVGFKADQVLALHWFDGYLVAEHGLLSPGAAR